MDCHAAWLFRRAIAAARAAQERGEDGADARMGRLSHAVARTVGVGDGDPLAAVEAAAKASLPGALLCVGAESRLRPLAAALEPVGLVPHFSALAAAADNWHRVAPFLTLVTLEDESGDGREVLVLLAQAATPPPLSLIVARRLDPATRWECLALGAAWCLVEPVDAQELAILAASYLRPRAAPPTPTRSAQTRILLAEDDAITARLVIHLLQRKGYEVHHFTDGQAAMDAADAVDADLVILDVNMPRLDGFTALTQLRSLHRYARRPIVLFTTYDREEEKVRAFMLGADDYITKPFSGGEFMARVMRLLDPTAAR